jgi:hypothetical protein
MGKVFPGKTPGATTGAGDGNGSSRNLSDRAFGAACAPPQYLLRPDRGNGAPVHLGKPELIGIKDLAAPDYGDAVPVHDDEIPVFWACGVTPQSVVAAAKPEFCITHYPGAMLVTDRRNNEFAIM